MPGAAGTYLGGRTSIWWHTFEDDPKHKVGICTNCGRQFRFTDKDYKEWLAKTSAGTHSTGGLPVTESSAKPHMAGSPIFFESSINSTQGTPELVEEPPIDMPLNEFLLTEVLKRYPERAAKLLMGSVVALKHLKPLTGVQQGA